MEAILMQRMCSRRAVLIALVVIASVDAGLLLNTHAMAQTAAAPLVPTFNVDPSWPKVPAKWKLGDQSSFAVDAQDNVWLLHRPRTLPPEQAASAAPPVMVFDSAGNFIKAWGGPATGYEWPGREHGIHIDYKGYVWIAGNGCPTRGEPGVTDDQLLKFTADGKFVMQIGHSSQSKGNADTQNLNRPADAWVHPQSNEVFVADGYGNHRIIVFDADTGVFKRMWGAFGNAPVDGDDHCEVENATSFAAGNGPPSFNIPHAIRVADSDGMVYVADRENRRVQMFLPGGTFVKQLVRADIPFAKDLALSPDREQRFLYVGGRKGIMALDRKTLDVVATIEPPGIIGTGHHIATDSKGNIYLAQPSRGMQKLTFKGMSTASQ
jgi:DNA-binding beta-propeller fold protein YncE